MKPAGILGMLHVCNMQTPTPGGPIPHVGGPMLPVGVKVQIMGMIATVANTMSICSGLPPIDPITKGSSTVKFSGKPAVRMGDPAAHGGKVALGIPLVLVGG